MNRLASVVAAAVVVVAAAGSSACFNLDSFVWNPLHCEKVTEQSCTDKNLCTACGEGFPFDNFGIDPALATRHPIALDDGETNDSWFFASRGGSLSDVTLVYSHGNFGGLEHYLNRVALLLETGANVYAVDYRGFGGSSVPAEPTEAQFLADTHVARAGVPAILQEHGVSTTALVVAGYSAGALSAVEMAVTDSSCGMMLEAPWPSVQAFAGDSTFIGVPGSFVTSGNWDNISKVSSYEQPYLQLHGSKDLTVRIELGKELFDNVASTEKEFVAVDGATHGNFLGKPGEEPDVPAVLGDDVYIEKVTTFLDDLACD